MKSFSKIVLTICIILAIMTSCSLFSGSEFTEGTIVGRIILPDGLDQQISTIYLYLENNPNYMLTVSPNEKFAIQNLEKEQSYTLIATSRPMGIITARAPENSDTFAARLENIVAKTGAGTQIGSVLLRKTGIIKGTVELYEQSEHIGVDVYIPGTSFSAKTDEEGNFTIYYVPQGNYRLRVEKQLWEPEWIENILVTGDLQSEDQPITVINDPVILYKGYGTVSGTVRLGGVTAGLAGISILLENIHDTEAVYTTSTNSSGIYTQSYLAEGEYRLTVSKSGYETKLLHSILVINAEITEIEEIILFPNGGVLKGTATLSDGNTHEGIQILAEHHDGKTTYNTLTNSAGNFLINNCINGTYAVTASRSGYQSAKLFDIVVTQGGEAVVSFPALISNLGSISGRVVLEDNNNHSSVLITAEHREDPLIRYTTFSSANGSYLFNQVESGVYTLTFERQSYVSATAETIQVTSGLATIADDITLHKPAVYSVIYHLAGGTNGDNPENITENEIVNLQNPVMEGHAFIGWFTESTYSSPITKLESISSDVHLYAKWETSNYTLIFDANANDADGSMENLTAAYGTTITLQANTFSREGYYFSGWSTTSNGTIVYQNNATVVMGAQDVTLFAVWNNIAVEKVAADKQELDIHDFTFTIGDQYYSVTGGFSVPVLGSNGSTISWSADPASLVSFSSSGKGNVESPSNDTNVRIIALLTYKDVSDYKEFVITVKALPWAKTLLQGSSHSTFLDVKADSAGNLYAAGHQVGVEPYSYGSTVQITGSSLKSNVSMIKYAPDGHPLWAKTTLTGTERSLLYALDINESDHIYACGIIYGRGSYSFDTGVEINGVLDEYGPLLLKYELDGSVLWAKTAITGYRNSHAFFQDIVIDHHGDLIIAGKQSGISTITYGDGVAATPPQSTESNGLLIKYDHDGTPLWARTITSGIANSSFEAVAVDQDGNIYVIGILVGTNTIHVGNGISITGSTSAQNAFMIKYDPAGMPLWAKSVSGSVKSYYSDVAVDTDGNIIVSGYQYSDTPYTYGFGVSTAGTNPDGYNGVLVKFNPGGDALWAKSVQGGGDDSYFSALEIDSSNNIFIAGSQSGVSEFDYGNGVRLTGTFSDGNNALLLKYSENGIAQWGQTVIESSSYSSFTGIDSDAFGNIFAAGGITGKSRFTFQENISISGAYDGYNSALVKFLPE